MGWEAAFTRPFLESPAFWVTWVTEELGAAFIVPLGASVSPPISFLSFTSLARAASASLRFCNLSSCHICHLLSSVKTRLWQVGTAIDPRGPASWLTSGRRRQLTGAELYTGMTQLER